MVLTVPALAITESEVEAQISASSRESVTGNVLIWFLCAVSFLKVSQKIDSFLASMGVNVGHTGGSMMAEAMIAMRSVTMGSRHRRKGDWELCPKRRRDFRRTRLSRSVRAPLGPPGP